MHHHAPVVRCWWLQISHSIFNQLRNATMDETINAAGSDDEQVCFPKGRNNWLPSGQNKL